MDLNEDFIQLSWHDEISVINPPDHVFEIHSYT